MGVDFKKLREKYLKEGGDQRDQPNGNKENKMLVFPTGTKAVIRFIMPDDWEWPLTGTGMHYKSDNLKIKQTFVCPRGHRDATPKWDETCAVCEIGSDLWKAHLAREKAREYGSEAESKKARREAGKHFPTFRAYGIVIVERILEYPSKKEDKEAVEKIPLKVPLIFGFGSKIWDELHQLMLAMDKNKKPLTVSDISDELKKPWDITSVDDGAFFIYTKVETDKSFPDVSLKVIDERTSLYNYNIGKVSGKFTKKEIKDMFNNIPKLSDNMFFPSTEEIEELASPLLASESGEEKYASSKQSMADLVDQLTMD